MTKKETNSRTRYTFKFSSLKQINHILWKTTNILIWISFYWFILFTVDRKCEAVKCWSLKTKLQKLQYKVIKWNSKINKFKSFPSNFLILLTFQKRWENVLCQNILFLIYEINALLYTLERITKLQWKEKQKSCFSLWLNVVSNV